MTSLSEWKDAIPEVGYAEAVNPHPPPPKKICALLPSSVSITEPPPFFFVDKKIAFLAKKVQT